MGAAASATRSPETTTTQHWDVGAAPDASLHISFLSSWVVGGDARLRLCAYQDCLSFRDGEADLHSCLIIRGADKNYSCGEFSGRAWLLLPHPTALMGSWALAWEGKAELWGWGEGNGR